MSGINQIALSLIRRNAPYRGPRTSDSWNDTIDEISNDLASIISEWNLKLYPLLLGVPDGTDDVNIDAFTNGLDGSQLYVDHDSTEADENGAYWNETYSRPITLKESLTEVREEIESNYNDLAALVAEASGALTHDQKRAIGLEIFSDDYAFGGVSILTRSQNNEYNIVQLAKDIYGASFSLDSDGIANFTNSISDALDAILTLHQGTWDTDVTLIHDIVNADVNDNAAIVQTKLDDSGAGAIDTFDIGVTPVETLLDDLNVARTVIRILKGTSGWATEILEPYVGGPVDLSGHIWDSGTGTRVASNPHGLTFDDVEVGAVFDPVTSIDYIRSVLGITSEHQQPPYALYPPEGDVLTYILSTDSVTAALAKLDDALESVSLGAGTHADRTDNPHIVTAIQIGADNIVTEVNANGTGFIDWLRVNKTGSDILDLDTKSHYSLTEIGSNTHVDIDSALTVLGTENTNDLRTDLDNLLTASFLAAEDITYSFLNDERSLIGTSANTLCAGDDSRLGAPAIPEDHGNEVHTSQFIDVTHIQGSGSTIPSSGEHYAADVYVEDSAGNFSNNDVEQVLADIFGGSVKTSSSDDIHARHNFVSGEDFTMNPVVNPAHRDLVVDDLKHTDIVAPLLSDLQHHEAIVGNLNIVDIDLDNVTNFVVGDTVYGTVGAPAPEGELLYVDTIDNFIIIREDKTTASFSHPDTITSDSGGSAASVSVGTEYNAYSVNDIVTGSNSGTSGTIVYIDTVADTLWINSISGGTGSFQVSDIMDNGDLGTAICSATIDDVDTYKALDIITTDAGATAEVIETDSSGVLIRVRDLVGTVSIADIVSNPRSPVVFTVDSTADREFVVDDSITGTPSTATGTIEKIDVPNKTLRILEATGTFTTADRIDNGASNTETEIDTMPAVTSSYYVGDIVTGSVSTETGVVTAVTGSIVSVGDRSGTFNASDFLRTNTTNYLGNSQFTLQSAQAPFAVDALGTTLVDNLNADLLDSQEGTYYLDAANLTGAISNSVHGDQQGGSDHYLATGGTDGFMSSAQYNKLVDIDSGTYNCVASATTNLDSTPSDHTAQYLRVGATVTVSGMLQIDPTTTATVTYFELALPVASNLTSGIDLAGTGALLGGTANVVDAFLIGSNVTNDTAKFSGYPIEVVSGYISYTYTYQVI